MLFITKVYIMHITVVMDTQSSPALYTQLLFNDNHIDFPEHSW